MVKFAAIEGGGTTWVAAIASDHPDNFIERAEFTTETPEITLQKIRDWLNQREFDAIGVASFGPIDPQEKSSTYGFITSTPKPHWKNTDVLRLLGLHDEFKHIPYKFDTDVNAPALAEYKFSSGIGSFAYITVGTGVGVGIVVNGETIKGLLHPEAGHLYVQSCKTDSFAGSCPYHGACIEGMCSTGSLVARLGCSINDLPNLPDTHRIWDICAYYIAQLCVSLILIASPERIAIGGGVLNRHCLYPLIRSHVHTLLNGYVQSPSLTAEGLEAYIVPSRW